MVQDYCKGCRGETEGDRIKVEDVTFKKLITYSV